MKKIGLGIATSAALLVLTGCGGSSDSTVATDSTTVATGTGYYVDSAVEGVQYTCGANSGVTGQDGAFTFEIGEPCRFELGGIQLREVDATDLVDGVKVLEDNPKVARFLQSIDFDGDPGNGIQIKDEVIEVLTQALEEYNISSDSILVDNTLLETVITEIDNNIADFSGHVVTEEEAIAHVEQTQTEITAELLAGKTFYVVGQGIINSGDVWYGEAAFNESLTSMTWTDFVDTQDSGEISIQIEGDKLLFLSDTDGSYTIIGPERSDYIEVTDYFADGSVESHTRFYSDKAKADAYVDSLNASGSAFDLETLIVGKTLYQHCADENGDWIATMTVQEDGNLLIVDNGVSETIPYRIDGNITYTTEGGVEKAHTLIESTDTYIKFDEGNGETTTFYFTAEAAQAAPADDCGNDVSSDMEFTKDMLADKTFHVAMQKTLQKLEFIFDNDSVSIVGDEDFNEPVSYEIDSNGGLIFSDVKFSFVSKNDDYIEASYTRTPSSFTDDTEWFESTYDVNVSSFDNSAIKLKDWFLQNGLWDTTITADGKINKFGDIAYDGYWYIEDNIFYFAYPDGGGLDIKAYKVENNRLLKQTDAPYTETVRLYYNEEKRDTWLNSLANN